MSKKTLISIIVSLIAAFTIYLAVNNYSSLNPIKDSNKITIGKVICDKNDIKSLKFLKKRVIIIYKEPIDYVEFTKKTTKYGPTGRWGTSRIESSTIQTDTKPVYSDTVYVNPKSIKRIRKEFYR